MRTASCGVLSRVILNGERRRVLMIETSHITSPLFPFMSRERFDENRERESFCGIEMILFEILFLSDRSVRVR